MLTFGSTGPTRAYVDTALLSAMARGQLPPAERAAVDQLAAWVQSSAVSLFSSTVAKEELEAIPEQYRAPHLQQYSSMAIVASRITLIDDREGSPTFGTVLADPVYSTLRGILPDENDARHLAHAKLAGIDDVLTLDERTILSRASLLRSQVGISVYTPSQFVASRVSSATS